MNRLSNPRSISSWAVNIGLRLYLVAFLAGCAPSKPPVTVTEARAMETRTVGAEYNRVLKASINALQDLYYNIDVIDKDLGLIVASRTTGAKQAETTDEPVQTETIPTWKKVLGVTIIIAIIGGIILLVSRGGNDDDDRDTRESHHHHNNGCLFPGSQGRVRSSEPAAIPVYKYKVTINLESTNEQETKVRVSAQGEQLIGGSIMEAGPIQETEFFQRFFTSMDKSLFLED